MSLLTQNTSHYKGRCDNVGDLRLVHKRGENFGAIQACIYVEFTNSPSINNNYWRYFSSNGAWTEGAAGLACRELDLGYLSKRLQSICLANPSQIVTDATSSTLVLTSEVYTRGLRSCTCVETANQLSDCIDYYTQRTTVATVNCSKCCIYTFAQEQRYYTQVTVRVKPAELMEP